MQAKKGTFKNQPKALGSTPFKTTKEKYPFLILKIPFGNSLNQMTKRKLLYLGFTLQP